MADTAGVSTIANILVPSTYSQSISYYLKQAQSEVGNDLGSYLYVGPSHPLALHGLPVKAIPSSTSERCCEVRSIAPGTWHGAWLLGSTGARGGVQGV